ncbi:Cof-type HAD-IIB family hydrolase [Neobacillus sp. LXY-4]|uniref:Cof-type HAD-IIB family hydrolase n=1 Tax=Neobacillus sp. LXY-4 TaxID=3379826 RepID=UPI003EE1D1F6
MKDYKIIFLDIDGTILRTDHTIEDSTKEAISKMKLKGIEVILATGRPLHELQDIASELEIDSFISYNGAYAIYKGNEIFKEQVDENILSTYINVAEERNHELILFTNTHNLSTNLESKRTTHFFDLFGLTKNQSYTPDDIGNILSLTVIANHPSEIKHYPPYEGVHFSQVHVHGMEHCFDVLMEKVNKGVAVHSMLQHLNIPRELAIAFGDGLNDKEMLSYVGEGVAMGNGHPELFSYAKHTTTDVDNSGIYNGLKMLGLLS